MLISMRIVMKEEDSEHIDLEKDVHNLLIMRNFHFVPQVKRSYQRENIFQTKCRIGDQLGNVFIDGCSGK